MPAVLRIDVHMDVICPWCLIGKHQLQKAISLWAQRAGAPAAFVQWHSVQLLPQVPDGGLDFAEFYEQRLGSAQAVRARQAQVREAASAVGVEILFERIQRFPNTRRAHQLLALAEQALAANEVAALLNDVMCAYFQQGLDLGDMKALLMLGQRHGLDEARINAWIQSGRGAPEVHAVPGVPYFVFNQRTALSGALSPDVLLAAMHAACQPAPGVGRPVASSY